MDNFIGWLETHDKLAGWAQFIGAMLALALTYFTAFAPIWRQKRRLRNAGARLLTHGYEAIESYHRTSANFLPFALSLRQASLTMTIMTEEISRLPIYEVDNQNSYSLARRLVAMGATLGALKLFFDSTTEELGDRQATPEEHEIIRSFVGERLALAHALVTGAKLTRPEWPNTSETDPEQNR